MCRTGLIISLSQIRAGNRLIAAYQAFKHANERLDDLITRVEGIWIKSEIQIKVVRDLHDKIPRRLRALQDKSFQRLDELLQKALIKLAKLSGQDLLAGIDLNKLKVEATTWDRTKYPFLESQLETVVSELKSWHEVFDPSWLFVILIQDGRVDTVIKHVKDAGNHQAVNVVEQIRAQIRTQSPPRHLPSIFVNDLVLSNTRQIIHLTSLELSTLAATGKKVLLDTTTYPEGTNRKEAVRDLARLLSIPEIPDLHLLRCVGVVQLHTAQFQYIFALPERCHGVPCSLREILAGPPPSLDVKFHMAKSLAKAVASLHAADFVHKNIRPETIIVFEDMDKERSIPYLVGFEDLRPSDAHSSLISDKLWERNLYRHPTRQGLHPQQNYVMQHDIYSLGVCLLEIGMWTSFVEYGPDGRPSTRLPITQFLSIRNARKATNAIKDVFMKTARDELPSKMGVAFTDLVLASLACLDAGPTNPFADLDDIYDADGITIGVAFIENILVVLESISLGPRE